MHIDKKTVRNLFFVAVGAIAFYWVLHETERFRVYWNALTGMLAPFLLGAGIAFIMNVPLRAIERRLTFIERDGLRRTAAIVFL